MTAEITSIQDHRLVVGDASDIYLSAARTPHLSVIQWLISAGAPRGARTPFASKMASATPPRSTRIVEALGSPALPSLPEFLVPLAPRHGATVVENIAAIRDAPADRLAREVADWPTTLPPGWRAAVDEPGRWRDDFIHAVETAWSAGRRFWDGGSYPIDREISRIGIAAVTGAVPALLNSLHPRLRYSDGVIRFKSSCPMSIPLDGRRLVLVPLLAPPHRVLVSFERSDVAYIAYPVLGRTRARGSDKDRLDVVMGQLRASILRRLVQPLTMQVLAGEIHCAASTATYHCDLLESAGLVTRERRGSTVWAMRTQAGDALVDMLA